VSCPGPVPIPVEKGMRKGLVKRPDNWRWSSYNNFSLDPATVRACPIRIDYVRLPKQYRG